MRVRPDNEISPLVAWIALDREPSVIVTRFPERHERFVAVVRRLGYAWSQRQRWQRRIQPCFHGSLMDRTAELGCELLRAGFIVDFPDDTLARRSINAEYEPEQKRWIKMRTSGQYTGWFVIEWSRGDDFYIRARALPGSRYAKPHVAVPADAFAAVQDFAEHYDFTLSPGAARLIEEAQARYEESVLVVPAPRPRKSQKKPAQPQAPGEIAPELRDDLDDDN
jgi:hypothetical protein